MGDNSKCVTFLQSKAAMLEFVIPKPHYTVDSIVGNAELLSCTECWTKIKHLWTVLQTVYLRMISQKNLKLYQNQIIPVKYTSFNTYEHGPRIFRHLCNIQYLNTLLCLIIVYIRIMNNKYVLLINIYNTISTCTWSIAYSKSMKITCIYI